MKDKKMNITDEELDRDIQNLYLDPEKDPHIELVGDEYFYKIYGKEYYETMKARLFERFKKDEKRK
ncbi:MAG: hypothetical protein JJU34_09520 [Lunatimonas sp.]|uniref:hypothetical protein n=1 Tax=Lunatimonas sp. TaxID=2060141 RepID=UPI00263B4A70|nr:hypothetical protein [Lunatimonas sp.]MCC5937510.1 hypothetical protein [Lunatimonas sp.]